LDPKQVVSLFNEVSLRPPQFSERNVLKDIRERKERKLRARGSSYR
jgi:23S rRNA pseudouridine2605 synthase